MTPNVARYILAADRHFAAAAEAVGTPLFQKHLEAAVIAQEAATDELVVGADEAQAEADLERRLRQYVSDR